MTRPAGRRSLFWTFAGAFLITAVAGIVIQTLLAVAVLRPLEERDQRSRAALSAANLAAGIAAAPGMPSRSEVDSMLDRERRAHGPRAPWIVFVKSDGSVTASPRTASRIYRSGGGRRDSPLERPDSSLERRGRRGPQAPPEVLARQAVTRGILNLGEVLVLRPGRPREDFGLFVTRSTLLFLPIAILASTVAGLLMVRILVRRLRKLETLAARVAEGDLSVRIGDRSGDEIGRLAERLDRMAERLAAARDQIEGNERQRRQLFADITHELATPLTSIRGYAETLDDPAIQVSGEERGRYVRGVIEESRRMDRLIRDLFELARLEAGAAPLAKEPLDWVALCRNTIERFEPRYRDGGLALAWRSAVNEAWIEADGRRVEQVLDNLLVNALRYVPKGGTVELGLERREGTPPGFRLMVSDDGPGMPPEELPMVFERFYRGGAARGDAGSGLGLAIVREIVERHGGVVRAEPRQPHGLRILVELPARDPL